MKIEDICKLQIKDISETNSILFLWTTFPKLLQGLKVMESWGFKYRCVAFTWVKRNKKSPTWFWGMGHWTRANAEVCLLGVKGKPRRVSASVHSLIESSIEEHSKKPNCVKDRIIQLMGDLPRIELFARQKTEGWDVFGNEVEGSIDLGQYKNEPKT